MLFSMIKKTFRLVILIGLFLNLGTKNLNAQGWSQINPLPTYMIPSTVAFPAMDTIYIAGDHSFLMRTTDGGESWTTLDLPDDDLQMSSIFFTNSKKGYTVQNRKVYRTSDGGNNWSISYLPHNNAFAQFIHFINDTTGFAFGPVKTLAKTNNTGQNWQLLSVDFNVHDYYFCMDFVDNQTGYIGGSLDFEMNTPLLRKTNNEGLSWQDIPVPSDIRRVKNMSVINHDELWIGSFDYNNNNIVLYHTTNSGISWETVNIVSTENSGAIRKLIFLDEMNGKLLTTKGIYSTADGGLSWTEKLFSFPDSPSAQFLNMDWLDNDHMFAVGQGPVICRSSDGGNSLENLVTAHTYQMKSIYMIDSLHVIAGGKNESSGYLAYSHDGGLSWQESYIDFPAGYFNPTAISDIKFSNSETGWASNFSDQLFKTSDGGISWQIIPTGLENYKIGYLACPDQNTIIGACAYGRIVKSQDQGNNWTLLDYEFENSSLSGKFLFIDPFTGFAVANNEITKDDHLYKTIDGGESWIELNYGSTNGKITAISFISSLHGIISTNDNRTLLTFDGGITWEESAVQAPENLTYIRLFDENLGIAVSTGNYVAITNNGGLTFETIHQASEIFPVIYSASFCDQNTGLLCGDRGLIMRYKNFNTSNSWFITETVENYFYPNPAKDKIQLHDTDYLSFSIFDIEGRLLYLRRNTGHHQVDVSFLKPGTYILALDTNHGMLKQKLVIIN